MAQMPGMPGDQCDGQMNCGMDGPSSMGEQEQGPAAPQHGAAGGMEANFAAVAPLKFKPGSVHTGMTPNHPAFGK